MGLSQIYERARSVKALLFHEPEPVYTRQMPIEPTQDRLYTVAEAAHKLNLSEQAIRNLCQRGRIKARKLGHAWVITQSELEKFEPRKRGDRITKR